MRSRVCAWLVLSFVFATGVLADELTSLVARYRSAVAELGGSPKGRADRVESRVAPILKKIGAVDTPASLGFLLKELDRAPLEEIRSATVKPILASSDDRALTLLVGGLARRSPAVQAAILEGVGAVDAARVKAAEKAILTAAAGRIAAAARSHLPTVLARLDSVVAAKTLLAQVQGRRRPGRTSDGDGDPFRTLVVTALARTRNEEVKKWLATGAYKSAGSDPARLTVVARLAGELKLQEARAELGKLIASRSPDVAAAAIESLSVLGLGDSADAIASLVQRGRRTDLSVRILALDALARAEGPGVDVVIKAARSRDAETRAIAMGSLVQIADIPRALDALVAGLHDSDPSVRAVALRSLSRVRQKGMIAPLITAMEQTRDRSFQAKIVELLFYATEQNFGLVAADWRKWWAGASATFEFPKGAVEGFTNVKARGLDYFGIEIASRRIGFVVDISSSMRQKVPVTSDLDDGADGDEGGTVVRKAPPRGGGAKAGEARKIDVLKRELTRVIKKLSADTAINIIAFDANYKSWQKVLQPLRGSGRAKVLGYVKAITTGSGTNVFDSLEFALKDRRVDTIFLLTDGRPTRGRITDPGAIRREIQKQNRLRAVTINTIAFGEPSDFLEQLAAENGGKYRFVDKY